LFIAQILFTIHPNYNYLLEVLRSFPPHLQDMGLLLDPQNDQDIQRVVDKILNFGYEELNVTDIEPYASQYAIVRQNLTRLLKNESNDEGGKARQSWLLG
jgi:hypothetical protein